MGHKVKSIDITVFAGGGATSKSLNQITFPFSEKPLRSDLSHAKLTQSPAQSSHTEFRYAHSSGFSLAEAMVMLVVISILLAVSAPLIARKANADQRRLVVQGNPTSNVVTAMGNNQNFGIGVSNPNAKLHVTANRLLADFVSTASGVAAAGYNPSTTSIFQVTPSNNAVNRNGFKVFADGTTNIRTCVPNYGNIRDVVSPYRVTEDGYIISARCVTVSGTNSFCPPVRLISANAPDGGGAISNLNYQYIHNVIIPVAQNNVISQQPAEFIRNVGEASNIVAPLNTFQFVPCSKVANN